MKPVLDTPRGNTWAEELARAPKVFVPSTHPTFRELDKLKLGQQLYPCHHSPEAAEIGYALAAKKIENSSCVPISIN